MLNFCTVCDYGYLNRTIALLSSLQTHCPHFVVYVLCLDDASYQWIDKNTTSHIQPILIDNLLTFDADLATARDGRTIGEFACTCKASFMLYLLQIFPNVNALSYLDSDLYFVSDPSEIYQSFIHASIYITPHRYSHHLGFMRNRAGIYNAGWLHINRNDTSLACLKWWREQSIEWCFHRVENGQFGEQRYLEQFKQRFGDVVEVTHTGFNLAPWNINDVVFNKKNGQWYVNGDLMIMVHFHGLKYFDNQQIDLGLHGCVTTIPKQIVEEVYKPYAKRLLQSLAISPPLFPIKLQLKLLAEIVLYYLINRQKYWLAPQKILDSWVVRL